MSIRAALASVLHLFVVFAFFAAGLAFVALPHLPQAKLLAIDLVSNRLDDCTLIGCALFFTAFMLFLGFSLLSRGRYLRIRSENRLVEIDAGLIRHTLEECFQQHFPKKLSLTDLEIPSNSQLEIGIALASSKDQKELLLQVEKQLQLLLRHRFGYTKPFHLIVKI